MFYIYFMLFVERKRLLVFYIEENYGKSVIEGNVVDVPMYILAGIQK